MNDDTLYTLTIVQKALEQICNEMAITLTKTAYSPNIKERRDFSCTLFSAKGDLLSSKEGIPVHLGSMEDCVKSVIRTIHSEKITIFPGDIFVHNNVYEGGTHLPDINLISPIFIDSNKNPSYFAACRAHHADVGGKSPGSMPALSETLFEEGVQIPGVKIWEKGELRVDVMKLILANVRTQNERKGDFFAQRSALLIAERRLLELNSKYGTDKLLAYTKDLFVRSTQAMQKFISELPDFSVYAEDFLDSDGILDDPVKIAVTITKKEQDILLFDFTHSAGQRQANCNATSAITKSCVFFVIKYILGGDFATNSGLFSPLRFILPENSIVNASFPYATSSGNVETSQRIVDVVFKALSKVDVLKPVIPAASQGTMNNIIIGGLHKGSFFTYYETIAGGSGATYNQHGTHAIHTHMTNTLNTPIEALELIYPLRIHRYEIRENSGGKGKYYGGNGLIREYEVLAEKATLNIQSERRVFQPYGLDGGDNGSNGKNIIVINHSQEDVVPGRVSRVIKRGDRIIIKTPGGGGFGKKVEQT